MLTKKADARHAISVASKAKVYGTLQRGKRRTVLISVFYNVRGISQRGPFPSRCSISTTSRCVSTFGSEVRRVGGREEDFFKPGILGLYRTTSVIFLKLRNTGKRSKGMRTAFSLVKVGCAKAKCLDDTLTVSGKVAGRVFLVGGMPAPQKISVMGRRVAASLGTLKVRFPMIMGAYYKNSDMNICVIGSRTRCRRTLGSTCSCRGRIIIRRCVGKHRFSMTIISKGTCPVVRVTPLRKFCSCGGGCRTNSAVRAYPTRVSPRLARGVRRCTRTKTGTLFVRKCYHLSFVVGRGKSVCYLRTGALPKVAPADLVPRRTGILKVSCPALYRGLVRISVGGCPTRSFAL